MTITTWSFTKAVRLAPTGSCVVSHGRKVVTCGGGRAYDNPRSALWDTRGPYVVRSSCRVLELDAQGELRCAPGKSTLGYDASEVLRAFARKTALGVAHLWDAPPVVKRYLRTGDPALLVAARVATKNAEWPIAWTACGAAKNIGGTTARNSAWTTAAVITGVGLASKIAADVAARNVVSAATEATWTAGFTGDAAAWRVAWRNIAEDPDRIAIDAEHSRRLARMLQAGARRQA